MPNNTLRRKPEIDRWVISRDTIAGINALEESVWPAKKSPAEDCNGNIDAGSHRRETFCARFDVVKMGVEKMFESGAPMVHTAFYVEPKAE